MILLVENIFFLKQSMESFFLFSYSLVFLFFLLFFSTFLWFFGLAGQRTKEYSLSAHFLPSGDEVRTQRKQKRRMIFIPLRGKVVWPFLLLCDHYWSHDKRIFFVFLPNRSKYKETGQTTKTIEKSKKNTLIGPKPKNVLILFSSG